MDTRYKLILWKEQLKYAANAFLPKSIMINPSTIVLIPLERTSCFHVELDIGFLALFQGTNFSNICALYKFTRVFTLT